MFAKDFKEHLQLKNPLYSSLESECRNEVRKGFLVRFTIAFLAERGQALLLRLPRWQTSAED